MTAPTCPFPRACPVPSPDPKDLSKLPLVTMGQSWMFHTCYSHSFGVGFNSSGKGDTRFAPLSDKSRSVVVPTMYGASSQTAALLETIFHDIHSKSSRTIYAASLLQRGLIAMTAPADLPLVDLRDSELSKIGLARDQIVSTTAAHYPCTREWAAALYESRFHGVAAAGILWQSRSRTGGTGRTTLS